MNKKAVILVLLFFCFVFVSCVRATDRTKASDFKLQDLKGETVSLSDYNGKKPVILFFWATWCPYCRTELKNLNDRYQQIISDGIELFGVDVGESKYRIENFLSDKAISYRMLMDTDAEVARSYSLLGVPTYVFIDRDGQVIYKGNYFMNKDYKALLGK